MYKVELLKHITDTLVTAGARGINSIALAITRY